MLIPVMHQEYIYLIYIDFYIVIFRLYFDLH